MAYTLLIGLAGGLAGGLLGVGGSVVMIPLLTLMYGPRQHLHQAAAMAVNFFVAAPAAVQHAGAGAVMPGVVRQLVPAAALCVVLGVVTSELSVFTGDRSVYLTAAFGVFLLGVALADLWRHRGRERTCSRHGDVEDGASRRRRSGWIVGAPTGFLGGLLGVGGGFIAVPLQRRLLGIPLRSAIANSSAMVMALSVVGAGFKNYWLVTEHGHALRDPFALATMLIPGAVVGSMIGSRLTHVLPERIVHVIFSAFLLLAAARMIHYALPV